MAGSSAGRRQAWVRGWLGRGHGWALERLVRRPSQLTGQQAALLAGTRLEGGSAVARPLRGSEGRGAELQGSLRVPTPAFPLTAGAEAPTDQAAAGPLGGLDRRDSATVHSTHVIRSSQWRYSWLEKQRRRS